MSFNNALQIQDTAWTVFFPFSQGLESRPGRLNHLWQTVFPSSQFIQIALDFINFSNKWQGSNEVTNFSHADKSRDHNELI